MARKNPHAVAMGRKGGRSTSPAKLRAIAKNAKKGGRKPKFDVGDAVIANEQAPGDYRDRRGVIGSRGPSKSEYFVTFTPEAGKAATGYMMSWWLDPA